MIKVHHKEPLNADRTIVCLVYFEVFLAYEACLQATQQELRCECKLQCGCHGRRIDATVLTSRDADYVIRKTRPASSSIGLERLLFKSFLFPLTFPILVIEALYPKQIFAFIPSSIKINHSSGKLVD